MTTSSAMKLATLQGDYFKEMNKHATRTNPDHHDQRRHALTDDAESFSARPA
jgi:hypothetical protein